MAFNSSRLESFRPWNPFQDKVQPSRDSLDICRYPTPVSISATSPPSASSKSASENTDVHYHKSVRHPLPPRPPSEVCLRVSLPQEIDPQHQSDVEDQASCVSPETDALDFDDILQLQGLPSSGDEDHPMICHDLGLESQYSLGFESYYPERACTTSQRSHVGNTGTSGLARECSDATIDPAILEDHHSQDIEQAPTRNENSSVVSSSPSSGRSARDPSLRSRSQRATNPGRQRSKVSKVAVVVDNRHMNRTGRSTRAKSPVGTSFSALLDQFSSLPVEERLQFYPGCLKVPCRNASICPPVRILHQYRRAPREWKKSRLH
ncbi:hypothetical protein N7494_008923 [Penicillium frequentans]|uniref:Uncharacterized protein n=1 Tax=Penicillium frequentans TaxID=3151616 RepID=A0AAD6GCC7_9EURO|nr:hypothetical protein N7494_008923 [Penicillium glabrum]